MTNKRSLRKRWLTGCGVMLLIVLAALGWYVHLIMKAFSPRYVDIIQIKSADGRYVATSAYSNGAMSDGYFFVSLQPAAGWHPLQAGDAIPGDEVADLDGGGIKSIAWEGSHKLIVSYDKDAADLDISAKTWHDVHIVYRGS